MSAWKSVKLGDVATIDRKTVNPQDLPESTFYLGLEHIARGGEIVASSTVGDAQLTSNKFHFDARHILYGKLRPNLAKVASPTEHGVCSTDILPILPGERLNRRYLLHYLRQPSMVSLASSRASGANLPRLSPTELSSLPMPLPPVEEQRRITSILDEADAIRAKRRAQLAHLDELPKALFHEMFSGLELTSNLADHLTFLTSGSRGWAKYYSVSGQKFLRIQNVKDGRLHLDDLATVSAPDTAEARRTRVQEGDVLLSITADLGRVGVIPPGFGDAYINQHLALLRAPGLVPEFLSSYLSSPRGQSEILGKDRGATKAGLNFNDVRSVRIPIPPTSEQEAYAEKVAAIRAERDRVAKALEADEELFAALQHQAFHGEL